MWELENKSTLVRISVYGQYCSYMLIIANWTGSWNLHSHPVYEILSILADAVHYNSLKSAFLYLQNMIHFPTTTPTVFCMFDKNGFHVLRRSDRHWTRQALIWWLSKFWWVMMSHIVVIAEGENCYGSIVSDTCLLEKTLICWFCSCIRLSKLNSSYTSIMISKLNQQATPLVPLLV